MELTQDPQLLVLHRPKCPMRMWYHATTRDGTRVYSCAIDGECHLGEGGCSNLTAR